MGIRAIQHTIGTRTAANALAALALLSLCGCANFWDEVTSKNFKFKMLFAKKPDPVVVLRDSGDGDERAKATMRIPEPKTHGGSDEQQNVVMDLLLKSATLDRQALCRLAAIEKLGQFKDPRAVQGLEDAFYNAGDFPADIATRIQCEAITALGETGNPAAVKFLVEKLKEPPAQRSDFSQQRSDRCTAAARALSRFKDPQAMAALAQALQKEKSDVALRDRIHEALVAETGKDYPADSESWQKYANPDAAIPPEPDHSKSILPVKWLTH